MKALEMGNNPIEAPIFLFKGKDRFLQRFAAEAILTRMPAEDRSYCCERVCDVGAEELAEMCATPSMTGGTRVVEAERTYKFSEAEKRRLTAYAAEPEAQTILILHDEYGFFDFLRSFAEEVDCAAPQPRDLAGFLQAEARRNGAQLDPAAAAAIVSLCGGDAGAAYAETKKLCVYAGGEKITKETAARIVSAEAGLKVFEVANALQAGDNGGALRKLNALLRRGENAAMLFATLAGAYRKLLDVAATGADDATICAVLKMSPGALAVNRRIAAQGRKTTRGYVPRLKADVDYFNELEYRMKSGRLTPEGALDAAFIRLMAKKEKA